MNATGQGRMKGAMSGVGSSVSQYWQRNIADSFWLRIFINLLAALAILFQSLVILGCVPGAPGSSSTASEYYLLQFNTANGTATTRLRTGYTAMCVSLSGQAEHCAITVGKEDQMSIRYLSTGQDDIVSFDQLTNDQKLNPDLYRIAKTLQTKVFAVLPAIPGGFLALGVTILVTYSILNRPWVGPASSWRQSQRNRKLDIMRTLIISLLGLAIVFSFAIAVANSQLFAALAEATAHDQQLSSGFRVTRGETALALDWLTVIAIIGFEVGIIQTHINVSSVTISIIPDDTAGSTGGGQYAAAGGTIEKSSLLRNAEPIGMNPTGLKPQVPDGGMGHAAGRGGGGDVMGGASGARVGVPGGRSGGGVPRAGAVTPRAGNTGERRAGGGAGGAGRTRGMN